MRLVVLHLSIFMLLCVAGAANAGTIYKSTGADGRTVYSDHEPPKNAASQTITYEDAPTSPLPEAVLKYRDELLKSVEKRLADKPKKPAADLGQPVLFWAKWCGYCRKAKAYLNEKGIQYTEYDIDTQQGAQAMIEANVVGGIPVLLWKGKVVRGFTQQRYDWLFQNRRQ